MIEIKTGVKEIPEHRELVKCLDDPKNQVMSELASLGFFPVDLIRKSFGHGINDYSDSVYGYKSRRIVAPETDKDDYYNNYKFIHPSTFKPDQDFYNEDMWQYHYTDNVNTVLVYIERARDIFEENIVEISIIGPKNEKLDRLRKMKRRIRPKVIKANKAIQQIRADYDKTAYGVERRFGEIAETTLKDLVNKMNEVGYNQISTGYAQHGFKIVMQNEHDACLLRFDCEFTNPYRKFQKNPVMGYFAEKSETLALFEETILPLKEVFDELCQIVLEERMNEMTRKIAGEKDNVPF